MAVLPKMKTIERKIHRWRAENESAPSNPSERTKFEIPEEFRKMGDEENVLLYVQLR